VSTGSAWGTSLSSTAPTFTTSVTTPLIVTTASSTTSGATITPSCATNQYEVTALAVAASIANPSGTPVDAQKLIIRIQDNGVARALTWSGSQYRALGVTLPTTTVASTPLYVGCVYNSSGSGYWDVIAVS